MLRAALERAGSGTPGRVQPAALNLTQATERGTVYRLDELDEIIGVAANTACACTWMAPASPMPSRRSAAARRTSPGGAVDVLSFGATKNGAMGAEAVVVFTAELAEPLRFRARRAGQVFSRCASSRHSSKLTCVTAYGCAAGQANAMAHSRTASQTLPGVRLLHPVEINEIFAEMPRPMIEGLLAAGFGLYDRGGDGVWSPHSTMPKIRSMLSSRPRASARLTATLSRSCGWLPSARSSLLLPPRSWPWRDHELPALIPTFIAEWQLSHSEVGWISGISYGAYVAGVPVLVSLTDRIDARRIVIAFSLLAALSSIGFAWFAQGFWSALVFRALGGLALGGTYMPGLKALTDRVEGPYRARYQSFYTASFSVGSSVSLFITGCSPSSTAGPSPSPSPASRRCSRSSCCCGGCLRRSRRRATSRRSSTSVRCCARRVARLRRARLCRPLLGAVRVSHLAGRVHDLHRGSPRLHCCQAKAPSPRWPA